ncbi:MAG: cation-transporting P-type ATPase [Mycobacterium sp.]|nr:cation-transporting P-type ATPase [Mycobacterium sp.]
MSSPDAVPPTPHAQTIHAIAAVLGVDPGQGLGSREVASRRALFGPNVLRAPTPVSEFRLLVRQLLSPVVALLAAGMVLSLFFSEWQQAAAIGVVLLINTAIGYFTERKALRSMEALRALGGRTARVRRDGQSAMVDAEDLVPGDVVLLEAGDVVSADLRCLSAASLGVDESALTGESVPVDKDPRPNPAGSGLHERSAMLFKGTHVVRGSGEGIVVGTGLATELGRITELVEAADSGQSPMEGQLRRLSWQLVWLTLVLAAGIALAGMLTGRPVPLMIETAIALTVAAIPEGLPIVATVVLARGMLRMARDHALVEKLAAVETLGSTTVLLTDKTGTLTENRMEVERLTTAEAAFSFDYPGGDVLDGGVPADPRSNPDLRRALQVGVLCGNADYDPEEGEGTGDPMEVALVRAGSVIGLKRAEELRRFPEVAERPFDPSTKWMATVHRDGDGYFTALKGAPEAVLALTAKAGLAGRPMGEQDRAAFLRIAEDLAGEGLRVLALATGPCSDPERVISGELAFLGLAALRDPPRAGIAEAVDELSHAGIHVVMATGDHPATALAIADAVGIAGPASVVTTGDQLPEWQGGSADGGSAGRRVFARVSPEDKLALIELFQRDGAVVAMIGDGVNDAPALVKADIGVAMGLRGTEVAREASDMVLLDDRFETIVKAAREGRVIFDNIRRFSVYLLSCNLAEVLVVALAIVVGLPLPLLPLQILFLNLVTDVFPAFALAAGEGEGDVLDRPPRPPREPIITRGLWQIMAGYAALIAISTMAAQYAAMQWLGLSPAAARTVSFLTIAFAQLWHVFNMRTPGSSLLRNAITSNRLIWYALVLCAALLIGAVTVPALADTLGTAPIGVQGWALAMLASALPLLAGQLWLVISKGRTAGQRTGRGEPTGKATS